MARKRLLTILAGAVAVIGLQVGSATALDAELDLGGTKVEAKVSEDGVEAKVDEDEDGDSTVEAKVSEDGVDAKVGDTEVSTEDATETVEQVEETTKQASGSDADATGPGDGGGDGDGDDFTTGGSTDPDAQVTTAGDADTAPEREPAQRPDALDPESAARFLPDFDRSGFSGGEVSPAFGFSSMDDHAFDDPVVAQAPSESGEWDSVSPEGERSDAELAAIPAPGDDDAVPAGLKLLAGLLVAGTGTLWHLTRRELAPASTGLRVG